MKLHNITDECRVMDAARRLGTELDHLTRTGLRTSFFNDYSVAVVKNRKDFDGMKDQLKKMSIGYTLIYNENDC